MGELSGVIEVFYILILVVIIWVYKYEKSHQIVHLKYVHFTVSKCYHY